jgi:electron transfer flavoprotein alpha subunit
VNLKIMNSILVLIEYRDNAVDNLSLQLLLKARKLADSIGARVTALIVGSEVSQISALVSDKGADKILVADNPQVAIYNPEIYIQFISEMIISEKASLVMAGYSFLGMEIIPAISFKTGFPLISNCTDIEIKEPQKIKISRPVFNGSLQVRITGALPAMLSFQKGALKSPQKLFNPAALDNFHSNINLDSLRLRVKEILRPARSEIDITKAQLIVGVGRGIGQSANIELAKGLAKAFGGMIAATRPVVDMGWLPPEYLVGLSGKTVTPKVYIACGMSGAAQHLAGMSDSQLIIAINKDPNAAIFNAAHYAIVGDLFQIIPAITQVVREAISSENVIGDIK